jgi:hypothetical protein
VTGTGKPIRPHRCSAGVNRLRRETCWAAAHLLCPIVFRFRKLLEISGLGFFLSYGSLLVSLVFCQFFFHLPFLKIRNFFKQKKLKF